VGLWSTSTSQLSGRALGLALLLCTSLAGCGTADPASDYDSDGFVIADEGAAPDGGDPPTDFHDFPAASDLLPRDFTMEETTGPLKGYVTKFYRVRNQSGAELEKLLKNWKSEKARILPVPQHNMLVITELAEQMPVLERVLAQIDVVPPQVEIEAKVVEILETRGYEYGFEFLVDRAPAGDTLLRSYDGRFASNSFLESLAAPNAAPFQGGSMSFASVGDVVEEFGDFEFIMRALESEGYAEIVSSPRIVCRSGQKAILQTQTKLPIQDVNIQNAANTRITTRYEPVGVTLEVTPQVVGRDAISVNVKPTVSNVVRFEFNPSAAGVPVPVIAERKAETRVDIRNGELLVIGGLLDKQQRSDQRGLPILSKLPLIGILFSSTDDLYQKTNVVFILRIRILTAAEKARDRSLIPMTREERTRREEQEEDE
jgi:general secretion pathway protein D